MKTLMLTILFFSSSAFAFDWIGEYEGKVSTLHGSDCNLSLKIEEVANTPPALNELKITATKRVDCVKNGRTSEVFSPSWFTFQFKIDRGDLVLSDYSGSYICGYRNDVRISCRERNGAQTIEFLDSKNGEYGLSYVVRGPLSFNGLLRKIK
ncbi:hypothetical protein D3C87_1139130 [compost metagenome]